MKEIKYIYAGDYTMAAVAKLKCPLKLEYRHRYGNKKTYSQRAYLRISSNTFLIWTKYILNDPKFSKKFLWFLSWYEAWWWPLQEAVNSRAALNRPVTAQGSQATTGTPRQWRNFSLRCSTTNQQCQISAQTHSISPSTYNAYCCFMLNNVWYGLALARLTYSLSLLVLPYIYRMHYD